MCAKKHTLALAPLRPAPLLCTPGCSRHSATSVPVRQRDAHRGPSHARYPDKARASGASDDIAAAAAGCAAGPFCSRWPRHIAVRPRRPASRMGRGFIAAVPCGGEPCWRSPQIRRHMHAENQALPVACRMSFYGVKTTD